MQKWRYEGGMFTGRFRGSGRGVASNERKGGFLGKADEMTCLDFAVRIGGLKILDLLQMRHFSFLLGHILFD